MPTEIADARRIEAEKIIEGVKTKELEALARIAQDAAEIVYLRIGEYLTIEEIAKRLNVTPETVEARLLRARQIGALPASEEIMGMFKNRLVPKAMDALHHHLQENSEFAAIATLKGAGVLVSHQRSQQRIETDTTLRIVVENRDGTPVKEVDPATLTGSIVGVGNPDDEEASVIRKNV